MVANLVWSPGVGGEGRTEAEKKAVGSNNACGMCACHLCTLPPREEVPCLMLVVVHEHVRATCARVVASMCRDMRELFCFDGETFVCSRTIDGFKTHAF